MDDDTSRYLVPDGIRCDDPSEFEQAVLFSAAMGDSRMSYLWQWALEIGFRAAGGLAEGVKEGRASGLRDGKKEGRKAGKAQGLKEGEVLGFEKGLSEGKRLGFVAGREFGEKQAAKLSKSLAPERILINAGTDSPLTNLFPLLAPPTVTYASASVQTDARCDTALPIVGATPSLLWADEPSDVHIPERTNSPPWLPPRDLSALRSDSSSSAPFTTLRYRAHQTSKYPRGACHAHRSACTRLPPCPHATRGSMPSPATAFAAKPSTASLGSPLD
ncbi:hypothetical protein FB451DRAFT_1246684 [Mycena latifolia]|nr:hypothetical protein FB451DRAFT_1246684 [Mycena latifolia]